MEFKNESKNVFKVINAEKYRIYHWGDGSTVRIENPTHLHVSNSGGHRLFDEQGVSHYIPSGWIHISWEAKSGKPNFSI